jgi:hypothetical protein
MVEGTTIDITGSRLLLWPSPVQEAGDGPRPVGAVAVSVQGGMIRVECPGGGIEGLDGADIVVEFGLDAHVVRLPCRMKVLVISPPPSVALLKPIAQPEVAQRRSSVRIAISASEEVEVEAIVLSGPRSGTRVRAVVVDVSVGGAKLERAWALERFDRALFVIKFPKGEPVRVEGQVLDRTQGTARIRFIDVSEEATQRMTRWSMEVQRASRSG